MALNDALGQRDLAERLRPSETQLLIAGAIITASGVEAVMVPIALPGASRSVWVEGQKVEHPNGFWPVDELDSAGYRVARDAADKAAGDFLGGQTGTSAYCVIRNGGDFAIFMGIYGPRRSDEGEHG